MSRHKGRTITKNCLTVLRVLREKGPMTPKDIREESNLPESTMIQQLKRLIGWGLIEKRPNLYNMNQTIYRVVPQDSNEIDMPVSCCVVLNVLKKSGATTPKEVFEICGLGHRTVKFCIEKTC